MVLIHVFTQYSNTISAGQQLKCPIQFQYLLICMNLPNTKANLKSISDKVFPCFGKILNRKHKTRIFGHTEFTIA